VYEELYISFNLELTLPGYVSVNGGPPTGSATALVCTVVLFNFIPVKSFNHTKLLL